LVVDRAGAGTGELDLEFVEEPASLPCPIAFFFLLTVPDLVGSSRLYSSTTTFLPVSLREIVL
jgi:hypothetical protein